MHHFTREELENALRVVSSTISNCEKMQPKFQEGTPQYTLLKNRIKALYLSKSLIIGENTVHKYTDGELKEALAPVSSIISKCEKAQFKCKEGSAQYTRLKNIIKAMNISKLLITEAIDKRS
ncbi:MAG: hypothetical protein JG775_956 [Defluviitaleaceae bacterium]|jgi:hypothetical protein|nr:hypothetical protein [Defluviitaleaceae bacterium]